MLVICIVICVTLPALVVRKSILFATNTEVMTSEQWLTAPNYDYPTITVCHPKYFNKRRLEGQRLIFGQDMLHYFL